MQIKIWCSAILLATILNFWFYSVSMRNKQQDVIKMMEWIIFTVFVITIVILAITNAVSIYLKYGG